MMLSSSSSRNYYSYKEGRQEWTLIQKRAVNQVHNVNNHAVLGIMKYVFVRGETLTIDLFRCLDVRVHCSFYSHQISKITSVNFHQ